MINRKKVIKIYYMFKNYTNNLFKKKYRPLIHNDL